MDISNTGLNVSIDGRGAVVGAKQVNDALESMKQQTGVTATAMQQMQKLFVYAFSAASIKSAVQQSVQFSTEMAKISTVVEATAENMDLLSKAAKDQAVQFGSLPITQAQALYEITQAGASNATEAVNLLTAANKLAVGGVTSVAVAADGLTSILNSYGFSSAKATDIMDAMFVTALDGKTTIEELSHSLGRITPIAAALGVSFDEVSASVASLTKGGLNTQFAVNGMRQVLASIAKPTSEAAKLAKQLGIDFTAAGLQSKGLAGFLEDVKAKTEGAVPKLAMLFGGVEALTPVLALTGAGARDFAEILDHMSEKAGATESAFSKLAASPGFAIGQMMALMSRVMIDVGDAIATVMIPAITTLIKYFEELRRVVILAGAAFAAYKIEGYFQAALAAATPWYRQMFVAFNPAGDIMTGMKAFRSNLADIATNGTRRLLGMNVTFLGIARGIAIAGAALWAFSDQIPLTADKVVTLKDIFDRSFDIIGAVIVSTYTTMTEQWDSLPDYFVNLMARATNYIIDSINGWTIYFNGVLEGIVEKINWAGKALGAGSNIIDAAPQFALVPKIPQNVIDESAKGAKVFADAWNQNLADAFGADNKGSFWSTIEGQIRKAKELIKQEAAPEKDPFTPNAGGGTVPDPDARKAWKDLKNDIDNETQAIGLNGQARADLLQSLALEYQFREADAGLSKKETVQLRADVAELNRLRNTYTITQPIRDNIAALSDERKMIGLSTDARADMTQVLALQRAALEGNVHLTDEQTAAYGESVKALRELREEAAKPRPFEEYIKSIKDVGITIDQAIVGGFKSGADAMAKFLVTGEGGFKSFGDVISNVMQQIISAQLQASVIQPIVSGLTPNAGGSGFFGAIKSFLGFANGAAFSGGMPMTAFANGGVVNRPTVFPMANGAGLMGEAGAEAVMPLRRLGNGRLGVEATGGGGGVFAPQISIAVSAGSGDANQIAAVVKKEVAAQMNTSMKSFSGKQSGSSNMKSQVDAMVGELISNPNSKVSKSLSTSTTASRILGG